MDISTNSPCQLLKKFIGDVVEIMHIDIKCKRLQTIPGPLSLKKSHSDYMMKNLKAVQYKCRLKMLIWRSLANFSWRCRKCDLTNLTVQFFP